MSWIWRFGGQALTTLTNEWLCIYAGTIGAENLRIDVWNSSTWKNVLTTLQTGWNNVSVSSYLTGSTFTSRFKGSSEVGDQVGDSFQIDAVLLHVWIPDIPNYELDLEVQWNNVNFNQENEKLCIYAGNLGAEIVQVYYWTGTGWSVIIPILQPNRWNNVSIATYLTTSTFTIRFKGALDIGDTVRDSWQIDAALIHV